MSFARAFSALTGASAVSMAAQVLRGKLAALVLGPAGVGIFNQLSLAWNVANVAGSLGTSNGIIQHGAEAIASGEKQALRRLTATFTLLLGGVSLALALAGVLLAPQLSNWLLHDDGAHARLVALLMLGVPIGVTAQTWRALLSAGRAVSQLVRAQIASDLGGAAIFVALVIWLGLEGAVIGFMASHLILFLVQAVYIRRQFGPGHLAPSPARFSWALVRANVGFGASGLLLIVLGNVSVMLVSRMVIDRLGSEANGFFANSWRLASVYLGAVTTTTISYYLPTLTRCSDVSEMSREVNGVLRFFFALLPPVMIAIMLGGDWIVWVILSKDFLPVAGLLLIMVPAELVRISGDSMAMQFVARKRLGLFTAIYSVQYLLFVLLGDLLMSRLGLYGPCLAYFAAMSFGTIMTGLACARTFALRIELATLGPMLAGIAMLAAAAVLAISTEGLVHRLIAGAILLACWLAAMRRSRELQGVLNRIGL